MKKQSKLCKCGHYQTAHLKGKFWPICMYCENNPNHEFELDNLSLLENKAESKGLIKKAKNKDKPWHWPYLRMSDGPEYTCPHNVGHSEGVHGCCGCCNDPNFPRKIKNNG
jgi:hypothetical protein